MRLPTGTPRQQPHPDASGELGAGVELPEPAQYFPVKAVYDVSPSLRPLGTDFGNGAADGRVFQIDRGFPRFRAGKRAARAERLSKYYREQDFPAPAARAVNRLIVSRLLKEHPHLFRMEGRGLECRLTGERLAFTPDWDWDAAGSRTDAEPGYGSGLDALAAQVPEDLAVTLVGPDGRDWLAAVHVCSPSAWVPEEKVGLAFVEVHAPVPGMEHLGPAAPSLVRATVERGPFVRFVWTISGTDRLNCHPEPPPGRSPAEWHTARFRPGAEPPFYFRTERQVLWGLPEAGAALFVIRPEVYDPRPIRDDPARAALLAGAIRSMSAASLEYKGLAGWSEAILGWLEAPGIDN